MMFNHDGGMPRVLLVTFAVVSLICSTLPSTTAWILLPVGRRSVMLVSARRQPGRIRSSSPFTLTVAVRAVSSKSCGITLKAMNRSTSSFSSPSKTHLDHEKLLPTKQSALPHDNRPSVQRVDRPRPARRLNHAFKYLYRHGFNETTMSTDPVIFLQQYGGYSLEQIVAMNTTFPPLLTLSVQRHLYPKLQFLKHTLNITNPASLFSQQQQQHDDDNNNNTIVMLLPPQYFGARLERILAPRHAFLVHANLPHGPDLFTTGTTTTNTTTTSFSFHNNHNTGTTLLWHDFLRACRTPQRFAALCNAWQQQQQLYKPGGNPNHKSNHNTLATTTTTTRITSRHIQTFDTLFARGLMAAARNELGPWDDDHHHHKRSTTTSTSTTTLAQPRPPTDLTSAQLLELLIQHGACLWERDQRGVTLLHWACGTGNLPAVQCLLRHFDQAHHHNNDNGGGDAQTTGSTRSSSSSVWLTTDRDHATPLHWAAAGVNAREFGTGGHPDVCRFLLEQVVGSQRRRDYVNQCTLDGNSALMWAAWSGSLHTVKLLVRHGAAADIANRNGCTVAHWAASGGDLPVCQYLATIVGVDFTAPNHGGNTPLTHAVAFGRTEIVEWLRDEILVDETNDQTAFSLAQDFVHWTDGDDRRKQVLKVFEDWFAFETQTGVSEEEEGDVIDEGDAFL